MENRVADNEIIARCIPKLHPVKVIREDIVGNRVIIRDYVNAGERKFLLTMGDRKTRDCDVTCCEGYNEFVSATVNDRIIFVFTS